LYAINRRVYVKSLDCLGEITQRTWHHTPGRKRVATYLVEIGHHADYLTHSGDLRAADKCCDECGRWMPASSFYGGAVARDEDGGVLVEFCFLCTCVMHAASWPGGYLDMPNPRNWRKPCATS
jgi:hypothetical protein